MSSQDEIRGFNDVNVIGKREGVPGILKSKPR